MINYTGDIVAIAGWLMLGGALFWGGGLTAFIGYTGGTMLAIGLVLAWREVPTK